MIRNVIGFAVHITGKCVVSLMQGDPLCQWYHNYMTTYSEVSFDHDTIYDNDGIKRLVPNLVVLDLGVSYMSMYMWCRLEVP